VTDKRISGPGIELLARLLGPVGPELTCEECFDPLDHYVELELAGAAADEAIAGMRAHLQGCAGAVRSTTAYARWCEVT
jgi:hypothetical protein